MPKPRSTCTECSVRRQKCDRRVPCGRCVARGIPQRCTIQWPNKASRHTLSNNSMSPSYESTVCTRRDSIENSAIAQENGIDRVQIDGHRSNPIGFSTMFNASPSSHVQRIATRVCASRTQDSKNELKDLHLLMPSLSLLRQLIKHHEKRLLWYHGCFHGPTFNAELEDRVQVQRLSDHEILKPMIADSLWYALLFAVIASSAICASPSTLEDWDMDPEEATVLSDRWHRASMTCLDVGQFRANHHIHAVQAIATLTMCAHTLGHSSEHFVLMGAAIRISQALGLHQLHSNDETIDSESSAKARRAVLKKEIGRRLFCQLCVQDWFSIPAFGVHAIHRGEFTTTKPKDRDYLTMNPLPEGEPNYVSYNNYLYDIARLIREMHEKISRCNTDYTRYEQIKLTDRRMRELASDSRPRYFDATISSDDSWPWFVPWARRSLTICFAHKMIVIHRAFLKRSFSDDSFSFTRRTCIAAAKTIINEASQEKDPLAPIIWIDQVFYIAAGIVLVIDAMHRPTHDAIRESHCQLVQSCFQELGQYPNSALAIRGHRLLSFLLQLCKSTIGSGIGLSDISRKLDAPKTLRYLYHGNFEETRESLSLDDLMLQGVIETSPDEARDRVQPAIVDSMPETISELFPPQAGFSNSFIFNELLGIA